MNEFQEIKYYENLKDESDEGKRTRLQIQKQKIWCEDNKVSHIVRTEKDMYCGEYVIMNLSYMAGRVRRFNPFSYDLDPYINILVGYLEACKSATVGELIGTGTDWRWISFLCYLHYIGKIQISLEERPFDNKTEVTLYGK